MQYCFSTSSKIDATTNYEKGVVFEKIAADMLVHSGYKILGTRVRNQYGEIDLIVQKDNDVVAVEVKQRRTLNTSLECISDRQKARISRAFSVFISERVNLFENYRIDVVCFDKNGKYEHIQNAFCIDS